MTDTADAVVAAATAIDAAAAGANTASPTAAVSDIQRLVEGHGEHADRFASVGKCICTGKAVTLCYRTYGTPGNPCVLLVQGLKSSLLGTPPLFLMRLVERGYYVVVYDNRDTGRSTNFEGYDVSWPVRLRLPRWAAYGERVPYTLDAMAEDGIGLLDALGVARAHVFGMSMGGMIVQLMTIRHPERVLSLSILFSHVGGGDMVHPGLLSYLQMLKSPHSDSVEDEAEYMVDMVKFLSCGRYHDTFDELRHNMRYVLARNECRTEASKHRQIAAIMTAPSRLQALRGVRCPTLVMHGACDPLIPLANGTMIAKAVPTAKLVIFPRLGHDFPPAMYEDIAEEMLLVMHKGDVEAAAATTTTTTTSASA